MTAVIERERKYEIDAATTVPRLDGTAGVRSQEEPVEHVLDATYFDTTDFRLLRAGITVRLRTGAILSARRTANFRRWSGLPRRSEDRY